MANFRSDNVVGVHDAILHAIAAANTGSAPSYGHDAWSVRAEARLREVFACDLEAYFVLTGTAANALALATVCPPHGQVLCHAESHVVVDECGAPELLIGSGKLTPLPGIGNKLTPAVVARALDGMTRDEHQQRPAAISLTQATELGTAYTLDEIRALASLARARGLRVHMDGARFANALVHLGCTPAAMTWQAGVDVLSFGATKNGALASETVISSTGRWPPTSATSASGPGSCCRRAASSARRMLAYLEDDLWLANACQANAMAAPPRRGAARGAGRAAAAGRSGQRDLAVLPEALHRALLAAGVGHGTWSAEYAGDGPGAGEVFTRWITSYETTAAEVAEAAAAVTRVAGAL